MIMLSYSLDTNIMEETKWKDIFEEDTEKS